MKVYSKHVDMRSREQMERYLADHFRYPTMNSWNNSTSYANNVKIHRLGLTAEQSDKLYEMIELPEFYGRLNMLMDDFARDHGYIWQVGFNGRSGGYLVLYQGYSKPSEYKSYCLNCGQQNFKTVEETGNCRCGRCGADERVNYEKPPLQIGVYPGRPTDMDDDFSWWDIYSLRKRVRLIQEFDKLCDDMLALACKMIDKYEVIETTVMRPHTVRSLQEVSA